MHNGRREPRRMRYSLESRLRIVRLVEQGRSPAEAAAAYGASRATGYRLWRRYQAEGWEGLVDRPSTPIRQPRRLSGQEEAQIIAVRLELRGGPQVLARALDRPASTIGKVLRRAGCSRLPGPDRVVRQRYERERPGELVHVDVKKLGRFWRVGKRIHRDERRRNRGAAGATCTSRSTTTRASPTPKSSKTSAAQVAQPSCAAPPAGTPSVGSRSNAC
jgi:transposase